MSYEQFFTCKKCQLTAGIICSDDDSPLKVINAIKDKHNTLAKDCQFHFSNIEIQIPGDPCLTLVK